MLKNRVYICLLVILFSCQSKKVIIDNPIIKKTADPKFPTKEIAKTIQIILAKDTDTTLTSLYKKNQFSPIWRNDTLIEKGISWLQDLKYHGLDPSKFNVETILKNYTNLYKDSLQYIKNYAKLDLLLTSTIRNSGNRIRFSTLNPKAFHSSWNYKNPKSLPHDSVWFNMIKKGEIEKLDAFFEPQHHLYSLLKKELKKIKKTHTSKINTTIDYQIQKFRKGDSSRYILPLKHKLLNSKYSDTCSMVFDATLYQALITFQRKHGLTPDGIIGKNTYAFLTWDTNNYINTIKVNMERLRWLPDNSTQFQLIINVPSQKINLFKNNTCVYSSKVIVGKLKKQTPIFQSNIDYLVFNPCWTVPKSIASSTILNGLKRDSSYLQKRNMFICINGIEISPDTINFNDFSNHKFPFQVFQRNCKQNALGEVKFMFKNSHSIYLHDTPYKQLFKKDIRTFSHGCIRVENPMVLAKKLLIEIDNNNTPLQKYINKGYPEKVFLNNPISINIIYLTCSEDKENNSVIFYKDVYNNDNKILNAL